VSSDFVELGGSHRFVIFGELVLMLFFPIKVATVSVGISMQGAKYVATFALKLPRQRHFLATVPASILLFLHFLGRS